MTREGDGATEGTVKKLGLLSTLYFSQGLPFGFFTQALPVLLRKQAFSLGEISLSSLLALPWALKFLWAPAVDRYGSARFGRRKSWIVPLQLGAVCTLLFVGATGARSMTLLMGAVLLLNLIAATQDIATDGWAVDRVTERERGFANGIQVAAYRVGMIVGGGALLVAYERLGAGTTFAVMAGLLVLATVPIVFTREPPRAVAAAVPETNRAQLRHFLRRPGAWRFLFLITTFKAGDAFGTGMLRPYLADLGLGLADIGRLLGTAGFIAGLLGALVGGALMGRLGRKRGLLTFGAIQALSVAGYAALALGKPSMVSLYVFCSFEHFASGMATAALFTCMMDWCSAESSATDYTVQASAVVISTGLFSSLSGFSAQTFGYAPHFAIGAVLAASALLVVWRFFPTSAAVHRLHAVAEAA